MRSEIKDGNLIITVPLNTHNPPMSKSRKTLMVAGGDGFHKSGLRINQGPHEGEEISISLFATIPRRSGGRRR